MQKLNLDLKEAFCYQLGPIYALCGPIGELHRTQNVKVFYQLEKGVEH